MGFEIRRTELVWPGKYDEAGKWSLPDHATLPFQVIERINEGRATREAEKTRTPTLFDVWKGADEGDTFEEGWRNKLVWGDNLLVMSSLRAQFAGKLDLIYIDPPFATGAAFSFKTEVGDDSVELFKEQSVIEESAYRDTWGSGIESYLAMMADRLTLMHELLSERGVLMVHIDWRVVHLIRAILDDIFGEDRFRNEIIWSYRTGGAPRSGSLPRKHDNILLYVKSSDDRIRPLRERQYLDKPFMGSKVDSQGRNYVDTILRDVLEGEIRVVENGDNLRPFNTRPVLNLSSERLGFDTQKPEGLVSLLMEMVTDPGDLVADFFLGSGTTAASAEKLGRRWIGCDLSRWAIHVSRKRLLEIADCKPLEILNLGKYERQHWQAATFGDDLDEDGSISIYEYVAFILRLYGATAVTGMGELHGKVGRAFVHVGAVDSPVTIGEIDATVEECRQMKGGELHILGWEWEMGVNDLMVDQAKQRGVKLLLRQIPREVMEEQAATRGQVRFSELAYLAVAVKPGRAKRQYSLALTDFVIPNPELIDDEVRAKIRTFSDYVDYWAVDWDFRNDTFIQGWVTYRTRKSRSLELVSDPHVFDRPGEYLVMVKVIDIFGNDTSKIVPIKVK